MGRASHSTQEVELPTPEPGRSKGQRGWREEAVLKVPGVGEGKRGRGSLRRRELEARGAIGGVFPEEPNIAFQNQEELQRGWVAQKSRACLSP